MTATRLPLLPLTTFGVPSGNYDGSTPDFSGDPVTAAAYYRAQGVQTVRYELTGFTGTIHIEATLDSTPSVEDRNWFSLFSFPVGTAPFTLTGSTDSIGNFVWLRARVEGFTGGTINYVTEVY